MTRTRAPFLHYLHATALLPSCYADDLRTFPNTLPQFSFSKDIMRNPAPAKAARAQLLDGGGSGPLQHLQHGAEIDRQTAVIDQLDQDAKQESSINQVGARWGGGQHGVLHLCGLGAKQKSSLNQGGAC